ncbi:MAG: late competence development ComFB family protein [Treponema sp.]
MNVHNIMEEYVESRVKLMYDHLAVNKPAWLICGLDNGCPEAASYVLNRIPPRYIVSSRGVVHTSDLFDNPQLRADIDALALEGIRLINTIQRPYYKNSKQAAEASHLEPSFNFPVFIGTVFDGSSFEPLPDATITLKYGNLNVDMIDKTWSNPCNTYRSTKGAYSFWVKPFKAEKADISRHFNFTVEANADGYDPVRYAFDIPILSDNNSKMEMNTSYSLKLQDLFLFRNDIHNPMEV